jgi:hypothetical protein
MFVPSALETCENLLGEIDADKEEMLNDELKFNLLLVSEVRSSQKH